MGPSIGLKEYEWSSSKLLKELSFDQVATHGKLLNQYRPTFWHLMALEFDSIRFLRHLLSQDDVSLSNEFIEASYLRYLDKQNHFRGLKRITSVLYEIPSDKVHLHMPLHRSDHLRTDDVPTDEFALLLAVALDKATKLHANATNLALFDELAVDCLSAWIRLVNRDNDVHYHNAIAILRSRHSHRLGETEDLLVQLAKNQGEVDSGWAGIFFHDTEIYPEGLLRDSRISVLDELTRRLQ
jgi:hypothetical protein